MNELMRSGWKSPSNIALVKYWGKKGKQLPANPSISFTLSECVSETTVVLTEKKLPAKEVELRFYFDKKENLSFRIKILKFFESISKDFKLLRDYGVVVYSSNTFPHSSGIASSASSMSSLALCLCELENKINKQKTGKDEFLKEASLYARLGSGSACRSVYPYAALWGKYKGMKGSSDTVAIPAAGELHRVYKTFRDTILIAASGEKKVSSRVGHSLMNGHAFADARYAQAVSNMGELMDSLRTGDLEKFGQVVENEALTLHAMMMSSNPSYILMNGATLQMIERIRAFRESTRMPVYFTLDAGPNIHLLYPEKIEDLIRGFVLEDLQPLCEGGKFIEDRVGKGPEKLK